MNNEFLSLVGLAKKAGRVEIGEEPVGAAARARGAKLILVASDAAENSQRRAAHFAEAGSIPWVLLPCTKAELGRATGRSSCAMAALTDAGFASALCAKLAAQDGGRYGEVAAALDVKAKKVLERQKEQRRHEKKLQKRAQKPWAPPPKAAVRPAAQADGQKRSPARKDAPGPKVRPGGKIQIKGTVPHAPKKTP